MKALAIFILSAFLFSQSDLVLAGTSRDNYTDKVTQSELDFIRTKYYQSIANEDSIAVLKNFIIQQFSDDEQKYPPIILAYTGGIEALKSKHSFWPTDKLYYLKKAMKLFNEALNKKPNNLEIRFMRYSILVHVPDILGYYSEEKSDRDTILKLLPERDYSDLSYKIQKGIAEFMIQKADLNEQEKFSLAAIFPGIYINE